MGFEITPDVNYEPIEKPGAGWIVQVAGLATDEVLVFSALDDETLR